MSGMRGNNFGDLWFLDHFDLNVDQHMYIILVIVDAATNYFWAVQDPGVLIPGLSLGN